MKYVDVRVAMIGTGGSVCKNKKNNLRSVEKDAIVIYSKIWRQKYFVYSEHLIIVRAK